MAQRLVKWYALRWGIECWHKVLKEGCQVERRQMKSARALERALALDLVIASRVMLLTRLGKTHPDLPAAVFYSAEELAVLGGFMARTSDGHPGAKCLGEGLRILHALTWYQRQTSPKPKPTRRRRQRPQRPARRRPHRPPHSKSPAHKPKSCG